MLAEPIYFFYVYNLRPFGKRRRQAESVKHAQPKGKPRMIGTLDLNSQHSGRLKYFTLVVEVCCTPGWGRFVLNVTFLDEIHVLAGRTS